MTTVPFTKLAGTGNDFVLLDVRRGPLASAAAHWSDVSRTLCDRRTGIGADGLLVLAPSKVADVRMRIFNPDGSEPSMCGNGVRCLALFASRHGIRRSEFTIETRAGIQRARIRGKNRVNVDLGAPRFLAHIGALRLGAWRTLHADVIDSGVPHLICWVKNVKSVDVDAMGRRLRHHRRFQPAGVNVDFVQFLRHRVGKNGHGPVHRVTVTMRTYERGVEGETRACGTGAGASAASAANAALSNLGPRGSARYRFQVEVQVPGGILQVDLTAARTGNRPVFGRACLEGDVKQMAQGTLPLNGSLG